MQGGYYPAKQLPGATVRFQQEPATACVLWDGLRLLGTSVPLLQCLASHSMSMRPRVTSEGVNEVRAWCAVHTQWSGMDCSLLFGCSGWPCNLRLFASVNMECGSLTAVR